MTPVHGSGDRPGADLSRASFERELRRQLVAEARSIDVVPDGVPVASSAGAVPPSPRSSRALVAAMVSLVALAGGAATVARSSVGDGTGSHAIGVAADGGPIDAPPGTAPAPAMVSGQAVDAPTDTCLQNDIGFEIIGASNAEGLYLGRTTSLEVAVTNLGSSPCIVASSPVLQVSDGSGVLMPYAFVSADDPARRWVSLGAGTRALLGVGVGAEPCTEGDLRTARSLAVELSNTWDAPTQITFPNAVPVRYCLDPMTNGQAFFEVPPGGDIVPTTGPTVTWDVGPHVSSLPPDPEPTTSVAGISP